eukprot:3565833-Amphidinium_carterae.2
MRLELEKPTVRLSVMPSSSESDIYGRRIQAGGAVASRFVHAAQIAFALIAAHRELAPQQAHRTGCVQDAFLVSQWHR